MNTNLYDIIIKRYDSNELKTIPTLYQFHNSPLILNFKSLISITTKNDVILYESNYICIHYMDYIQISLNELRNNLDSFF